VHVDCHAAWEIPLEISHLTGGDHCCRAAPRSRTEQFFRQTPPFVVLTAFFPDWQDSSNYGNRRQTYAKIEHGLALHSPQNGAVCKDIDSHAQYFYPIFKDRSGSARTKLSGDWQAMPELRRHSCQAR
jgi:hypothetical protein